MESEGYDIELAEIVEECDHDDDNGLCWGGKRGWQRWCQSNE